MRHTTDDFAVAEPLATPAPWSVHPERQGGGQIGYHIARVDEGGHECIGTLHSAADANLICAIRNAGGALTDAVAVPHDPLDRCQVCGDPLGYTALLLRGSGDYVHDDCGAAREAYTPELRAAFEAREYSGYRGLQADEVQP